MSVLCARRPIGCQAAASSSSSRKLTIKASPIPQSRRLRRRLCVGSNSESIGPSTTTQEPMRALQNKAAADQPIKLLETNVNSLEKVKLRAQTRRRERKTYLFSAIASSTLLLFLGGGAIFVKFYRDLQYHDGHIPYTEFFALFALTFGAFVAMEFYSRYAHDYLWHRNEFLWSVHKSHHTKRTGPFEANDIFAVANALPAIALLLYGFIKTGPYSGVAYGSGLGITLYGIAYMFVHDGLVHKRFPVGPIADLPYLKKVAAAHRVHHMDQFQGKPFGLFLGPQELQEAGLEAELERVMNASEVVSKKA